MVSFVFYRSRCDSRGSFDSNIIIIRKLATDFKIFTFNLLHAASKYVLSLSGRALFTLAKGDLFY